MRNYPKLDILEFGQRLLLSKDLDPIYVALAKLCLDPVVLKRWLLAYWCTYHAGVSCYLAEQETAAGFWTYLQAAAINQEVVPAPVGGRWPRGHERRHWRGANAMKSYADLRRRYGKKPENMADYCANGELPGQKVLATQTTCAEVMKRAKEHVGFGPWIGFKVADMAERVLGTSVSFDGSELFLFDSPREAAEILYKQHFPNVEPNSSTTPLLWSCSYLKDKFQGWEAPPYFDRVVNLQEVETILCKWKSHLNGHYPLYNDLVEISEGLLPWTKVSPLARDFFGAMPVVPA